MIIKTLQEIINAGFQVKQGPNAWYFPEGVHQPANIPRIHIGGNIDHVPPATMNITFVSIGPHGAGQNLAWNAHIQRWELNTPNINWGTYKNEMENVLTTLGIAV
jgi:hypothetical protein